MPKAFASSKSHSGISADHNSKTEEDIVLSESCDTSSSTTKKNPIYTKMSNVQQLLARIAQEIDQKKPANVIHFIIDFLCKHYPEHLNGFSAIWNGDPDLKNERIQVVEFFKYQKIPVEIATHFINAGFDTIDTLCTLSTNSLDDVEKFNSTKWLPGHKVRLQQTFNDVTNRVKDFKEKKEASSKSSNVRYINTPNMHNPILLPKVSTPILMPTLPHTSLPLGICARPNKYLSLNKTNVTAPYIFKR
ncbi:stripes inner membrane complex protein, putative [Hepatocystis sp. ex Piliocolobus tephrosceles]|nr:stripes inner membrane complex protein, putative [Hepatocystis sp. ex Piliocolobus tephrosceles]